MNDSATETKDEKDAFIDDDELAALVEPLEERVEMRLPPLCSFCCFR